MKLPYFLWILLFSGIQISAWSQSSYSLDSIYYYGFDQTGISAKDIVTQKNQQGKAINRNYFGYREDGSLRNRSFTELSYHNNGSIKTSRENRYLLPSDSSVVTFQTERNEKEDLLYSYILFDYEYSVDQSGNIDLQINQIKIDSAVQIENNQPVEVWTYFVFNSIKTLGLKTEYLRNNGLLDTVKTYVPVSSGSPDFRLNSIEAYEYNSLEQLISRKRENVSSNNQFTPSLSLDYTYDAQGREFQITTKRYTNDTVSSIQVSERTFDQLYEELVYFDLDPVTNERTNSLYFEFFYLDEFSRDSITSFNWDIDAQAWNATNSTKFFYSNQTTSTKQVAQPTPFLLYPNPAHDFLYIVEKASPKTTRNIKLFDAMGKLMLEEQQSGQVHQINTKGLPPGSYFLLIDNQHSQKIMIQ